jgi:hypothetical protein
VPTTPGTIASRDCATISGASRPRPDALVQHQAGAQLAAGALRDQRADPLAAAVVHVDHQRIVGRAQPQVDVPGPARAQAGALDAEDAAGVARQLEALDREVLLLARDLRRRDRHQRGQAGHGGRRRDPPPPPHDHAGHRQREHREPAAALAAAGRAAAARHAVAVDEAVAVVVVVAGAAQAVVVGVVLIGVGGVGAVVDHVEHAVVIAIERLIVGGVERIALAGVDLAVVIGVLLAVGHAAVIGVGTTMLVWSPGPRRARSCRRPRRCRRAAS